jgi:hypothetical protein
MPATWVSCCHTQSHTLAAQLGTQLPEHRQCHTHEPQLVAVPNAAMQPTAPHPSPTTLARPPLALTALHLRPRHPSTSPTPATLPGLALTPIVTSANMSDHTTSGTLFPELVPSALALKLMLHELSMSHEYH